MTVLSFLNHSVNADKCEQVAQAVTQSDVRRQYERPPSFTDLLPWMEYDAKFGTLLLEDGISCGVVFELSPVGTEARTHEFMTDLRDNLQTVLTDALPEADDAPWVLQCFVQDEPSLRDFESQVSDYPAAETREHIFTQEFQSVFATHLAQICRDGGLFIDSAVTGARWRGQLRRIRAVIYRRYPAAYRPARAAIIPERLLNEVADKFEAALLSCGVRARRCDGQDIYEWLLRWINPSPDVVDSDPNRLLEVAPYPGDESLPFGSDFAEALTLSMPRSDADTGIWWFDGLPHSIVTVQQLRQVPHIGHLTAERQNGDNLLSVFDGFPEYTTMVMTLVVRLQDKVRNHITRMRRASVGDSAEARLTRENAEAVELRMAEHDKLFPVNLAFYVRGRDESHLQGNITQLQSLLLTHGLQPIANESDLLRLDSYLRNLPMAFDTQLDRRSRHSRLHFTQHIANLLPVYGRSRGTGHPGLCFFNRGAEPMVFDPLNAEDRKKNGHMLVLGPTGAGKSALMVYLLMQMMAIYRPRVFIIEAGGSFTLLGKYFQEHGVSVNPVTLNPGSNVSLPPFAGALSLLEQGDIDTDELEDDASPEADATRDRLGEMEIAARIMITGGDEREDARMTRADRLLIRNTIYAAAKAVRESGRDQCLTEDVVGALHAMGKDQSLPERRRERAAEMGDAMALFCSGLAGQFFNRPGEQWPEADVTILEMGMLAREGYEDQMLVAYTSIMNHIHSLVESRQHDTRQTLVVTDEGHIITTNPLLARYVIKITKMWRKLGAWFWIATQNLEDFPDAARRMLNMMEWWLCLTMPKEEIEQIARFKDLSAEQRSLLLSARKEPGKYTEGVVLADTVEALFRNVPPALCLALAMTEKHEKAERHRIMQEQGCDELQAVYVMAERIAQARECQP